MTLKKVALLLCFTTSTRLTLIAQQLAPTSGDVVVRLVDPVDFASARPLQSIRSTIVSSTNPAVPVGNLAILQVQNRDGSYTLKLLRIAAQPVAYRTMSQAGISTDGSPASGQQASLSNGTMLRFTLTQQDGSPGPPIQQAAAPVTKPAARTTPIMTGTPSSVASNGTSKDRAHFEIEGVMLGQTLNDTLAAEKAYSPKQARQQGFTTVSFKTKDLSFVVMFSKAGILNRMDVLTIAETKGNNSLSDLTKAATTSAMYKKAMQVYGKPNDVSAGDEARWESSNGSAVYVLDGDSVEVLAAGN